MSRKQFILSKKQLIILTIIIFFIGICTELLVKYKVLILVNKSFIDSIFVSLVTISTLSVTILAIIINSLFEKCYGFYIKEIINFDNEYFKISLAIPFVIGLVLLVAIFFAFGFINLICIVLVIISIFIINLSVYVWKVTTDTDFCKNLVSDYIGKVFLDNPLEIISKVFSSFTFYIENNNLDEVSKCVEIVIKQLKLIYNDEKNYEVKKDLKEINYTKNDPSIIKIENYIRETFILAEKKLGLIIAVKEILKIYNQEPFKNEGRIKILINEIISEYQFFDELEISSRQIINSINGLFDIPSELLENDYKSIIIYKIFSNIYANEIINDKFKKSILNNIIKKLMKRFLEYNNDCFLVKQKALLYIFNMHILLNQDHDFGAYLMGKLSLSLYNSISITQNKEIFDTMSMIYFVIYLYSKYEVEGLKDSQINYIKQLIDFHSSSINLENFSFKYILKENFDRVNASLINFDKKLFNELSFFEYFRNDTLVHSKVPTFSENKLFQFAIYNYFLNWHDTKLYILNDDFWQINKNNIDSILLLFDNHNKLFKEKYQKEIIELANWVNLGRIKSEKLQKELYDKLIIFKSNEVQRELESIQCHKFNLQKINLFLNAEIISNKIYGYSPNQENFLRETKYELYFITDERYTKTDIDFANNFFLYFKNIINNHINSTLAEILLAFDLDSVKKLLLLLKDKKFINTNYLYINDLAFSESVINSPEFNNLRDMFKDLNIIKTPLVSSRLYFANEALNFKIEIVTLEKYELSENEVTNYLESYKISENVYDFSGALVDRNKAVDYIKNLHVKYLITYIFKSNLKKDSGIRIKIDYKRNRTK